VLDQVALAWPMHTGMRHYPAHGVELMIAWEDELAHAGFAAAFIFCFDFVDEVLEQVQHTISRPDAAPQVVGGIAALGGRFRRIAGATELALVER
jgi:hypothetical protein